MGRKIRVCVADDDAAVATSLCDGLEEFGFETVEVHTGGEALDACSKNELDLILLDVSLPDMDGFEVCKQLKASEKTEDISVIFVTGKTDPGDISKGYSLGAIDYITKPYNLPMVMVRVEAAVFNKSSSTEQPAEVDGVMDVAYTDQLTGLKNHRYLMERLQEEVDKAHRHDFALSCIVIDVDEIHAVSAENEPAETDDLLAEVAMTLRNATRTYDVLTRYEEGTFVALLPHTPLQDAMGYATKIMDEVDATIFADPSAPTKASLSVGIVTCRNGSAAGADAIFGEAMRTLLKAKGMSTPRLAGHDLNE